jgi:hypothetical protein
MKIEHLSDEQIQRFRDRRLSSPELLDIDDHLADCRECRDRAWARLDAAGSLSHLRSDINEGVSPHLEYSDVVRLADNKAELGADPASRHLEDCSMCRQEIEDLREFQSELATAPGVSSHRFWTAPSVWGAVAATIVLAVLLSSVFRSPRQQPTSVPAPVAEHAELQLPADYRQIIEQTVAQDSSIVPSVLDPLRRSRGTLRSAAPEVESYNVEAPAGVTVSSDRPRFRWQAVPGVKSYTVSIYDTEYRKVAESPSLTATDWTPSDPLPRETLLSWQVSATVKGRTIHFPSPPIAEAVFQVMSARKAEELESAQSRYPQALLLLGVLCFNDGALDAAADFLGQIPPGSSDATAAARLLDRIHAIQLSRR